VSTMPVRPKPRARAPVPLPATFVSRGGPLACHRGGRLPAERGHQTVAIPSDRDHRPLRVNSYHALQLSGRSLIAGLGKAGIGVSTDGRHSRRV
jgi:hypothetical protein